MIMMTTTPRTITTTSTTTKITMIMIMIMITMMTLILIITSFCARRLKKQKNKQTTNPYNLKNDKNKP